jgi:hypothetical protein
VSAGHERGSFFMPYLDKTDLLLVRAQRFHNAVDAVSRQTKNDIDSPIDQSLNQHIGSSFGHRVISLSMDYKN